MANHRRSPFSFSFYSEGTIEKGVICKFTSLLQLPAEVMESIHLIAHAFIEVNLSLDVVSPLYRLVVFQILPLRDDCMFLLS